MTITPEGIEQARALLREQPLGPLTPRQWRAVELFGKVERRPKPTSVDDAGTPSVGDVKPAPTMSEVES